MSYPYGGYVLCINQICEDNQIRGKYEKNVKKIYLAQITKQTVIRIRI